jgi:hypothetical protein
MPEQKTKPTSVSVKSYLSQVADAQQRADCFKILQMMKKATGLQPRMWGPSMVGFGEYHYKYASGHEGDCFLMGFAPRKGTLSLYFMPGLHRLTDSLKKLGKYKTGKACLYIKRLDDVDVDVLRDMIERGFAMIRAHVDERKQAAAKKRKKKDS